MSAESIPTRFASAAASFAARIALCGPEGQWTYAELDHRSDQVAGAILRQRGPESEPVALLFEHDAPLIAAIFGVLKANKIYVVLDPNHPPGQLAAMLASSGARLLLADRVHAPLARAMSSGQVEILTWPQDFSGEPIDSPLPISGDAGAWLMFTSGSTSAPKGVWQNHAGLVREAEIYARLAGLAADDRVSLVAACGLSASGMTLFGSLLGGATLCLFPLRSQGVERLADWLHRQRVTIFHSVPTVFRHLARVAQEKKSFARTRLVRLGGEQLWRGDVDQFRRVCPDDCLLVQSFSSTETGLVSTFAINRQTLLTGQRVPAGHAIAGVEIFLVDADHQPLKPGDEGRIAVRSPHLRQGYWRQPALTAGKFRVDARDPRARVFVSNDLGRFMPDGALEHLGRADQLVKIRGQRVDLEEVEHALLATGLAQEAVVTAAQNASGETRLSAHVVPQVGTAVSPQAFRRRVRSQLPEHMIPNDFVSLQTLPLTAAGKVDRAALAMPRHSESRAGLSRAQRPRDVVEERLKRIWEATLNISPIARTDDFYELGGTSLQSVEVLLQIEELLGISLPPSTLAEHSTIEKLSALVSDRGAISSPGLLVKLREGAGGRPLFLIHTGRGDLLTYGLLTRRLKGRPIFGLQSPGLHGECWPLTSVRAMARRYQEEIFVQDPTGPYLLAGACIGGMIAFEMARMMVQQGKPVGIVGLLNAQHPLEPRREQPWPKEIYAALRTPLHDSWRILRWKAAWALGLARGGRGLQAYRQFIANLNRCAYRAYRPDFYPGAVTQFMTTDPLSPDGDSRLRMCSHAQSARIIQIPGTAAGLFLKPAVDELARQLEKALEGGEAGASSANRNKSAPNPSAPNPSLV